MKPYTYLIRWTKLDISYYGVRYAQDCDPSDLWNPYKTSSTIVAEFVIQNGEPDIIQVRKIFTDAMSARIWECKVQRRMKVVKSEQWLNRHDSMAPPVKYGDEHHMRTPELRKIASDNNSGSGNPMFGKKQQRIICEHCNTEVAANTYALWHGDRCEIINPLYKESVRLARSGENNPLYGKVRPEVSCLYCQTTIDVANFGRYHGDFCLINPNKKPRKPREIKSCEYCGKATDVGNYAQWHGNKCKHRLTSLVANTDLDVYNN